MSIMDVQYLAQHQSHVRDGAIQRVNHHGNHGNTGVIPHTLESGITHAQGTETFLHRECLTKTGYVGVSLFRRDLPGRLGNVQTRFLSILGLLGHIGLHHRIQCSNPLINQLFLFRGQIVKCLAILTHSNIA